MTLPVLPNTINFLAVALVIKRSISGPAFVFHYPPHVLPSPRSREKTEGEGDGDDEDDDSDGDDAVSFLERTARSKVDNSGTTRPDASELLKWKQDDHTVTESGTHLVPWEHVAGFPTKDLENILTPAPAYHKTLFQLSLDPLYCVSYPIHVPDTGTWKKTKQQTSRDKREDGEAAQGTDTESAKNDAGESEDKQSSMTMFNLVFILKPEKHEAKDLVDVMYSHIIKKINKAYNYCQQRSDFVWKDSKRILALKEKAREDSKS